MRFLSVCSGIEAAKKICTKCNVERPIDAFHKHPGGPHGRHSWCKSCANAAAREKRSKVDTPERKRQWNLSTRYGLSPAAWTELLNAQQGRCAICQKPPTRPVVDHDHATGRVRGILCHGCNIKLPAVDDAEYLASALRYLGRSA